MKTRNSLLAVAAIAMLTLAGCAPSDDTSSAEPGTGSDSSASESASPSGEASPSGDASSTASGEAVLSVASTDLGDIVVDADGMTVYMFDNDTQGSDTSSCTGQCLVQWPPVIVDSEQPTAMDVTGELGTIETPEGELQLTLDGWPLYLWQGDSAAGDTTGQGVGGVWWVLDPAGVPIKE
ncbi:COG4315 family predicted lipoprotein [Herbiconiux sp. SYSU D00978]|uniref:COG4315 family predicted lipoprotein n=1 Tax=Herbiconiux sp. SYSU D00978 TaxID=2812562 RepID=UPI001A968FB4|nr:hypothetical protein [Herbiconiux sp. SYSU D00978]